MKKIIICMYVILFSHSLFAAEFRPNHYFFHNETDKTIVVQSGNSTDEIQPHGEGMVVANASHSITIKKIS